MFLKVPNELNSLPSISQILISNSSREGDEVIYATLDLFQPELDGTLKGNLRFRLMHDDRTVADHAFHIRTIDSSGRFAVVEFSCTEPQYLRFFEQSVDEAFKHIEVLKK